VDLPLIPVTEEDIKPDRTIDLIENSIMQWRQAKHEFKANITARSEKGVAYWGHGDRFPWDELLKDGISTGLVFMGTNMGSTDSKEMISSYKKFFEDHGYRFEEKAEVILNVPNLLDQKISQGELDYLIKEAHSGGDEKNICRVNKCAKLLHGVKKGSDHNHEIYLLSPNFNEGGTDIISNQDFGSWIKEREQPLIYWNTSCWSHTKAVNECAAAGAKLINIPTLTVANTFRNFYGDANYKMFESFLEKKTFPEIRKAMAGNALYRSRNEDHYIFPDEDLYKKHITDLISFPIDTKIQITKDGNPYNFGAAEH